MVDDNEGLQNVRASSEDHEKPAAVIAVVSTALQGSQDGRRPRTNVQQHFDRPQHKQHLPCCDCGTVSSADVTFSVMIQCVCVLICLPTHDRPTATFPKLNCLVP